MAIRYAFFDFDDTLCIHKKHFTSEQFDRLVKASICINGSYDYYRKNSQASRHMKMLVAELRENGIECRCLSMASNSSWVKAKKGYLDEEYNCAFEELIITATREAKIEYIKLFAREHECRLDEIVLVEDHPDTISIAVEAGISVISAMEVVVRYD